MASSVSPVPAETNETPRTTTQEPAGGNGQSAEAHADAGGHRAAGLANAAEHRIENAAVPATLSYGGGAAQPAALGHAVRRLRPPEPAHNPASPVTASGNTPGTRPVQARYRPGTGPRTVLTGP